MASLTQVDVSYVEQSVTDLTQTIVAFHRLHRVSVVYIVGQDQFEFYKCQALFELKWQKLGSWKATNELKSLIGVIALEAYDLFAFIGIGPNGTDIILTSFDGTIRMRQTVSRRSDAVCVDYNQKTREFFIGFENGILICIYTKCSPKFEYTVTLKRLIKVNSSQNQSPVQIVSQDFIGILYVLTNDGSIICVDGTKFELIYTVRRSAFSMHPFRIYCDKFGTDFIVRLHNEERTKEQLECWHPPEDYTSCRVGRFERFLIPLSGRILGVSFESLGLYSGRTLLQIFTSNKKLQLWSCLGAISVHLEAEVTLNIPLSTWKQFQQVFSPSNSSRAIKDPFFSTLFQHYSVISYVTSGQESFQFSALLLLNVLQLSAIVGVQLPQKKDQEVSMYFADLEFNKYGFLQDPMDSQDYVQKILTAREQMMQRESNDDESSVMSETLVGALSDLAKVERSIIDERASRSNLIGNSIFQDSISSVQLTDQGTHDDSASMEHLSVEMDPQVKLPSVVKVPTPIAPKEHGIPIEHSPPPIDLSAPRQRALTSQTSNLSEFALNELYRHQQTVSQPAPIPEIFSSFFFPNYYLYNADTTKCNSLTTSSPAALTKVIQPSGMLLNTHHEMLTFTQDGLCLLTPSVMDQKMTIEWQAVAYRLGLIAVISNFKDCLVCDLKSLSSPQSIPSSPPLRVLLTMKNHVKVTSISCADIFLKTPPLPMGGGNAANKKKSEKRNPATAVSQSSDQVKVTEPVLTKYLMLVVGDSEGFVHVFLCDANFTVLQSETFQAYTSMSVKYILFTADATRPSWQASIDYLPSSNKIGIHSLPGSAIITASQEGEIKVWQPFSLEIPAWKGGVSFEKFFEYNQIRWRLSGVFAVDRSYVRAVPGAVTLSGIGSKAASKPSTAPPSAPTVRRIREMVSLAIAPGCLTLLVTFTNGTIEEWTIPGLLDTNETALATSQKEIWSNVQVHKEEIVSFRIFVHGPLSMVKPVYLLHDHERDSLLAKLATYIRVPNRMKMTAGLTFQEIKTVANASSLTTCSKDSTVVLWSFQSSFFGNCSFLVPVPVRKFYLSAIPCQALCYSQSITSGTSSYHGNSVWRLDVIVSGKVQGIISSTRSQLFQIHSSVNHDHMLTDYRNEIMIAGDNTILFEDDLAVSPASNNSLSGKDAADSKMIMAMPVVVPIYRAQYLVNGSQIYNAAYDPFRMGMLEYADRDSAAGIKDLGHHLLSTNLLEEWGKVEPTVQNPIVSTVQLSNRPTSSDVRSSIKEIDSSIIPSFQESSLNTYDEYMAEIRSRPNSARIDSARKGTRSLSPVVITIPPTDMQEQEEDTADENHYYSLEGNLSPEKKKVSMGGIQIEIDAGITLTEFEESIQNQKYVVEKERVSSPPKPIFDVPKNIPSTEKPVVPSTPLKKPDAKQSPMINMSREKQLKTEESLDMNSAPLIVSVDDIQEGEEDAQSSPSQRTKLSVTALSFTKGSRIVRTISFTEDDIIDTKEEAEVAAASAKSEEGSQTSEITVEDMRKHTKGPAMTKAMELRQKMQAQLKERLELRQKHGSNIYGGDARQSTMKYTSKTSLQKQDIQQFQKGIKQSKLAAITSAASKHIVMKENKTISQQIRKESGQKETEGEEVNGDEKVIGRLGRQPVDRGSQRFVVEKKKDETPKITHQLIVAQTKLLYDLRSPSRDAGSHWVEEEEKLYASDVNIGLGSEEGPLFFEDESKTPLDLESTGFSLSLASDINLDDDFNVSETGSQSKALYEKGSSGRQTSPSARSPKRYDYQPTIAKSLEIDLPDQRLDKRRKYALAISQNIAKINTDQADKLTAAITKAAIFKEDQEDLDDISIVSHYFDRNAKPIFVEREKPPRQQLRKRKFPSSSGSIGTRSSGGAGTGAGSEISDLDWDDEEETEEVREQNATLMDMYLDDLSPEERKMFENLDEDAKRKLMRELRMAQGTGKRKNVKTKDLFKKLTKMATEQARMYAMLGMEISLELVEVTDESLAVNVNSNLAGPVMVILAYTHSKYKPAKEHFYTIASIQGIPGYCEHRSVTLEKGIFEETRFDQLRPETSYTIFAVIDRSNRDHFPFSDEVNEEEEEQKNAAMKPPKILPMKTLEERLEIEWSRLDAFQRTIELQAAIRSEFVQMKAFTNYPVIQLPTTDELEESQVQKLLSPATSDKEYHSLKTQHFQSDPALKHIPVFIDWWVGHKQVTSKTRAYFHEIEAFYAIVNKKMQKSLSEDRLFAQKDLNALIEYAKTNIKNRARLNRDSTGEEILLDPKTAGSISTAESIDPLDDRVQLMRKFRSWYKGGFVLKELEMKLARLRSSSASSRLIPGVSNESFSPSITRSKSRSTDTAVESATVNGEEEEESAGDSQSPVLMLDVPPLAPSLKRLQERTQFLESLLAPVDKCVNQVQKLFQQYQSIRKISLHFGDLKPSRRNSITTKDANALMAAKKFYDLCKMRKLFGKASNAVLGEDEDLPEIEIERLDPFQYMKRTKSEAAVSFTPKPGSVKRFPIPVVLQRISGCDIFRPVHVNSLKPEEPPPLDLKCLPGTSRRPNKPWQSMTRQEQELELTLACALDSIWELAVNDGVPVPNPEDRLLSTTEFPMKAYTWETFRKWYAGDEERNPVAGQGIPTLQRVIFSEQLEMSQVENDLFVAQLMEEQDFRLPAEYKSLLADDNSTRPSTADVEDTPLSPSGGMENGAEAQFLEQVASKVAGKSSNSIKSMRQAYEKAIFSPAGAAIRNELFMQLLTRFFKSRLMNMMKYLWPPGLKRIGLQYLYPRSLSFYYPKFTLPLHRFHLFPSRSPETFNREEILSWYSQHQLDEDDAAMTRAEKKGVKQRAYHEWLTLEPQRQEYSRTQMAMEDSAAYQHRELQLLLEKRWKYQEERLARLDEDLDAGEYDPKQRLRNRPIQVTLTPRELRLNRVTEHLADEKVKEEQEDEREIQSRDDDEQSLADLSAGPEEEEEDNLDDNERREKEKKHRPTSGTQRSHASNTLRISSITPRTEVSREYSEIAFPDHSAGLDEINAIPPLSASDQQAEQFKSFIDQHLSTSEQEDLSAALAVYDQSARTAFINEELAFPMIDTSQRNFRILNTLPQEYWYIFEESFEFRNGSGIYNDDEAEEAQLRELDRAREAVENALEFEKALSMEKKRREAEELARLRREEQDRRLKEGMVRRRKIREHLEWLKQQRIQRLRDEEEAKRQQEEEARLAAELERQRLEHERYLQYLEEQRLQELELMREEEIYMRDLKIRSREIKSMEHEDIMSFLIEQMSIQYQVMEQERMKELEFIYQPFEPYRFKRSRLPELEQLLTFGDVEKDLEEIEEDLLNGSLSLHSLGEKGYRPEDFLASTASSSVSSPVKTKSKARKESSTDYQIGERGLTGSLSNSLAASPLKTSLTVSSPIKPQKEKKYRTLPIPVSHDKSTIDFSTIAKKSGQEEPASLNQKMNHLRNTTVKTSENYPTKRKIRQFFDITKLSVNTLAQPLRASIPLDNTKTAVHRLEGELLGVGDLEAAEEREGEAAPPLSAKNKNKEKLQKTPTLLPFNPYDTQWELQQSPPLTLSNLPFFVRPSSQGLNAFKNRSEQSLSTPNLAIPPPSSFSRSRRGIRSSSDSRPTSQSFRRELESLSKPSSTGRVALSPIDFSALQNPVVAFPTPPFPTATAEAFSDSFPASFVQQEELPIAADQTHPLDSSSHPLYGDDSDLASQQTKQTMETYESEYNKTNEVTVDYINSLLSQEQQQQSDHPPPDYYSPDELLYMQSLAQSQSQSSPGPLLPVNVTTTAGDGLSMSSLGLGGQDHHLLSSRRKSSLESSTGPPLLGSAISLPSLSQRSSQTKKKKKELTSLATDLIEKSNQKDWLEYLKLQRKLTTASLSTIDSQEKEKLRRILGKGGIVPISAQLANQTIVLPQKGHVSAVGAGAEKVFSSTLPAATATPPPKKRSGLAPAASTSALPPANPSGLDFKTSLLAKTASEEVNRLKTQREILKQYIAGHALLEEGKNDYYLLACEPKVHEQTILERNPSVQKFAQEIYEKIAQEEKTAVAAAVGTVAADVAASRPPVMSARSESMRSFEEDLRSSVTGGSEGGAGADYYNDDDEDEASSHHTSKGIQSKEQRKQKQQKLKKKKKPTRDSLLLGYPVSSLESPSIPPPLTAKNHSMLSASTSHLLNAVSPLHATVTPLTISTKEKQKQKGSEPLPPPVSNPTPNTNTNSTAAVTMMMLKPNPFILGNKITIPKESKKEILAKSKQLLLERNHHHSNSSSSQRTSAAVPDPSSSSASSRPGLRVEVQSDPEPLDHPTTSNSLQYESSTELKTGRSLDLFIRTPRIVEPSASESYDDQSPTARRGDKEVDGEDDLALTRASSDPHLLQSTNRPEQQESDLEQQQEEMLV